MTREAYAAAMLPLLAAALLALASSARAEPGCSPVSVAAALAPAERPAYPAFERRPAARPTGAALMIDGRRRDVFIYPAVTEASAGAAATVIVADASNGAVLWSSVLPAEAGAAAAFEHAPVVLSDDAGLAYRAYAGDLAGGVWRLDLPAGPATDWAAVRLADLGELADAGGTVSFPAPPDLFRAVDGDGRPFDGLVFAALVEAGGERRLDLVLLRDYAVHGAEAPALLTASDLTAVGDCADDASACPPASGPGWYLADATPGDALAVAPLIDGGRVFLATHDRLSLDCDTATALRFATVIDLESGAGLLGDDASVALGRQTLAAPAPEAGEVRLPGLAEALGRTGAGSRTADGAGPAGPTPLLAGPAP